MAQVLVNYNDFKEVTSLSSHQHLKARLSSFSSKKNRVILNKNK
jgi:hypothetical protein